MCVNSHNKNRMTHPLWVAKNCTTHPLPRVQKLMTHPLSAPAHPPILFDQSLKCCFCGVNKINYYSQNQLALQTL